MQEANKMRRIAMRSTMNEICCETNIFFFFHTCKKLNKSDKRLDTKIRLTALKSGLMNDEFVQRRRNIVYETDGVTNIPTQTYSKSAD